MSGRIACCAGGHGRFGNSLFQYAYARAYAEMIGAELLINPEWIGRRIFKNIVGTPAHPDPTWKKTEDPTGQADIFLHGYFQRQHHMDILSRAKLREWFEPADHMKKPEIDLAFHKRRGDYIGNGSYALIGDGSYERAAEKFGFDPKCATVFSDETSGPDRTYDDFFAMAASKALFRANSSFSFWAGVLCKGRVFSPVVEDRTGWLECEFVEGNHSRMFYLFGDLNIKE